MGTDKQYDGYESFDYLNSEDYHDFDLPPVHGFEQHPIELSPEDEDRLESVIEGTVISLHDHPFYFPADVHENIWDYVREGRSHWAYEAIAETPLDAVFDMHFNGLSGIHSKHGWKWDDIVHDVSMRACDLAHSDYAFQCRNAATSRWASLTDLPTSRGRTHSSRNATMLAVVSPVNHGNAVPSP
jgi:membrane dipeptidase